MPTIAAPTFAGAGAKANLLFGAAQSDASQALQLKMAALETEMRKRQMVYSLLRELAQKREQEKQAAASKGGWGGAAGAGIGGVLGGILAVPTFGLSIPVGAALGAAAGGMAGGAIDQAQGHASSNLGSNLLNLSTGFMHAENAGGQNTNPFYTAAAGAKPDAAQPFHDYTKDWE